MTDNNKNRHVADIKQIFRVRGDKRYEKLRADMQSFTPEEDKIILDVKRKAYGNPYKAAMELKGRDLRSVIARWEDLDNETKWTQKNPDSYTGSSKEPTLPEDDRFYKILENVDDTYRGDMRKVKFLANDISTMVKDGKLVLPTKTTRDVVYENDYKEISDAQIEAANTLEEKINDKGGDDYKAIVKVRELLQQDSIKLPGRDLDEEKKEFLKTYMQKKMDIIELFMLDDDDMEGGKRKNHRRSKKKSSHKRKTKKNNKRKTKKQKTKRRKRTTIRKKK